MAAHIVGALFVVVLVTVRGKLQVWEQDLILYARPPRAGTGVINVSLAATELQKMDESTGDLEVHIDMQVAWKDARIITGLEKVFQHECSRPPIPKNPCICQTTWAANYIGCENQTGCPATACDGDRNSWCAVLNPGCDEDPKELGYFYCGLDFPNCTCSESWSYEPMCKGALSGCPVLLCDGFVESHGYKSWCQTDTPQHCGWAETIECIPDQCDAQAWKDFMFLHLPQSTTGHVLDELHLLIKNLLVNASKATIDAKLWTPVPNSLSQSANVKMSPDGIFTADISDEQARSFPLPNDYTSYPFDSHNFEWCIKFDESLDLVIQPGPLTANLTPAALSSFAGRTRKPFVESALSPHVGEKVIEALNAKGFSITSIEASSKMSGTHAVACLNLKVHREYQVVIFRLFLPMILLVSTPMAGFFLPVRATMPRIATGFISFLSLQVFASRGYSMLPKEPSSLVFIDAVVLTMTELLYLAVLENIVAIRIDASVSHFAAEYLDRVSRFGFPSTMFVVIVCLSGMGVAETNKNVMLLVVHLILGANILLVSVTMTLYMLKLPQRILSVLISDINSGRLLWSGHADLDAREFSTIFQFIDKDQSGFVSCDELIEVFRKFGLRLSDEGTAKLREKLQQACGEEVHYSDFQRNFKTLFGSELFHHGQKKQTVQTVRV